MGLILTTFPSVSQWLSDDCISPPLAPLVNGRRRARVCGGGTGWTATGTTARGTTSAGTTPRGTTTPSSSTPTTAGRYNLNVVDPYLETAWFQHPRRSIKTVFLRNLPFLEKKSKPFCFFAFQTQRAIKVKTRIQAFAFSKCSMQRYAAGTRTRTTRTAASPRCTCSGTRSRRRWAGCSTPRATGPPPAPACTTSACTTAGGLYNVNAEFTTQT
jgi:hypothetical protein